MTQYLGIFTGEPMSPADMQNVDQDMIARGMAAWHKWMEDHAAQVAESGGPLGKTKRVSKDGVEDIRNRMAGMVIVTADSHEAAAALFKDHPHFTIFPGDGVEVMEILPVPGM